MYSTKFKLEVAKVACHAKEKSITLHQIAEKYGVNVTTVVKWRNLYKLHGDIAFDKDAQEKLKDQQLMEKDRRIAQLEAEIDILRKAAALFAKNSMD